MYASINKTEHVGESGYEMVNDVVSMEIVLLVLSVTIFILDVCYKTSAISINY